MNREIKIKKSVGHDRIAATNIYLFAVLLDGRTMRQFTTSKEAEEYAKELRKKYPNKTHHGGAK